MAEQKNIIEALILAQSEMPHVRKNAKSHHGEFANIEAVMTAIIPVLKKHGLAVLQRPVSGSSGTCTLETILYHTSGESMNSTITIPMQRQNDPQAYGAAMTYGRRYALMCMLGLVTEDDDASSASVSLEVLCKQLMSCKTTEELYNIAGDHRALLDSKVWQSVWKLVYEKMLSVLQAVERKESESN